jgi:hypothetical protein
LTPRCRHQVESKQGSFNFRGVLQKKRARAADDAADKADKDERAANLLASKERKKQEAAAAAAAWSAKNKWGHCVCYSEHAEQRDQCATGHGHLCEICGEVKQRCCGVAACIRSRAVLDDRAAVRALTAPGDPVAPPTPRRTRSSVGTTPAV